jgi:branched-subunit amino acid ABC-type transport system permease component
MPAARAGSTAFPILVIEQVLNGLQFGVMLFLMAAGLTLIFGVMGLINLAHGSLYMVGAFAAAAVAGRPARSCWRWPPPGRRGDAGRWSRWW